MRIRILAALFSCLIWVSAAMLAQTSTGSITGTVKDESGGVIPGATVTATRSETGENRVVLTNDGGIYRVLNVAPGVYAIKVEMTGFKTLIDKEVGVTVGGLVRADFSLAVGDISEELVVQSEAELLQKDEGRMSNLVESAEIQDLPLNGRNAYQLAQLGAGISATLGVTSQSSASNASASFNANGQSHRGNNFLMDGTDNNYIGIAGVPSVTPQVDIIEEFRVATNNFSAEYGRNGGAIVNILTKSGTNRLHGSIYEYHRNDALDAREFFDGKDTAPLLQHTFGVTLGGPIIKDKLWFFGGYEGFRETSGESALYQVESAELIDWLRANRPGSIALQLFERFPLTGGVPSDPSFDPNDIQAVEIRRPDQNKQDDNQWNLRLDHAISDSDKLYGRFTRQTRVGTPTDVRPSVNAVGNVVEQAFTFSETHVFSPTIVNEFRTGWNEREPNFNVQQGTFDVPTIAISGFSPDFGAANNIPQFFARHTYQVSNQLSWSKGAHALKIGGEFRHGRENSDFQANTRGTYNFSDLTDFLDDAPFSQSALVDPTTGLPIGTPRHFRVNEWALYVQDDWKVTPRFTLNLGLRYENFRPPYEPDGIQSNVQLGAGNDIFERLSTASIVVYPEGADIYQPDDNNFAPRFGFAWDPTGGGVWAIRGGYGISYNRIFMNVTSNIKFNPPFSQAVTANTSNNLPIRYTIPVTIDPELVAGAESRFAPNILDPDLGTQYVHSFFFGVQREIFGSWLLEANYVSTLGHKLYTQEHYNRFTGDLLDGVDDGINPAWNIASDDFLTASINQAYHAGQFSIQKRFSDGLGFRANYTWAKNIDDDSDVFGATSDDVGASAIENRKLDRGLSSIHVGNRFAASWVWDIPFGSTHGNRVVRNLFGGWGFNGVIALQDGTPATITADSSTFTQFTDGVRRGDFNADGFGDDHPDAGTITASDVNPADARFGSIFASFSPNPDNPRLAFPRPEAGTNGTLGRNTFFYDGFSSVDLALFKSFKMRWFQGEEATWEFRWEVFNVFNNVNTRPWEEDIGSANFGRTFSTQDAREMQFALKFIF